MRTSSKVMVSLGILTTIGALAGVAVYRRNKPKSAQALMDQGLDLVDDTLKTVEASVDKAVRTITSADHTIKVQPKEELS